MATLRDIRRRIKSAENIEQITQAMKMVAAAKLRRLQDRMFNLRDYSEHLQGYLYRFIEDTMGYEHPLLEPREGNRATLIAMSGDRGLCGSFNTNALRNATAYIAESSEEVAVFAVGKRGVDHFRQRKQKVEAEYSGLYDAPSFVVARQLVGKAIAAYLQGRTDKVVVSRPQFINTMTQRFVIDQLLPFDREEAAQMAQGTEREVYLVEPSPEGMATVLLEAFLAIQMHRALMETACSEFAARMVAMDLATNNAQDMIQRLTLEYNRARQNAITKEILDIIGGAEGMR